MTFARTSISENSNYWKEILKDVPLPDESKMTAAPTMPEHRVAGEPYFGDDSPNPQATHAQAGNPAGAAGGEQVRGDKDNTNHISELELARHLRLLQRRQKKGRQR